MARISLKSYADLIAAFQLGKNAANANAAKNRLKPEAEIRTEFYDADEKYSNLIKIGPVVEEAIDGVHSLEEQVAHLHEFVVGQLGAEANFVTLPNDLKFELADGSVIDLIYNDGTHTIAQLDAIYSTGDIELTTGGAITVNTNRVINQAGVWIGPSTNLIGAKGAQGAKGQKGEIGAKGNVGLKGQKGEIGAKGNVGASGTSGTSGVNGAKGATGTQGAKGQKGEIGAKGNVGASGTSGTSGNSGTSGRTASIRIAGVEAGGQGVADVTNVGNSLDAAFQFIIPTGPMGPVGPKGSVGQKGAQGAQGIQGIKGQKGEIGAKGNTGNTGAQGQKGQAGVDGLAGGTGAKGATGATGAQGIKGATGAGGATGPKGNTGAQGPTGAQGLKGAMGPQGPIGPQGPQGAMGPQGAKGATGAGGATGARGATGPQGGTGPIGPQGGTGAQGLKGATGVKGATGAIGPQGATGPQGKIGPQGLIGPQGGTGAKGQKGERGITGGIGPVGPKGNTGAQGAVGPQGPKGNTGAQGATGPTEYESMHANFALNGGGDVSWNGTTVSWSARLIAIPVDKSLASSGHLDIGPGSFNIPSWSGLWYRASRGQSSTYQSSQMIVAAYNSSSVNVGDGWILIATHNGDSGTLKWMGGMVTIPRGGTYYTDAGQTSWAIGPTGPKGSTGAQGAKGNTGAAGAKGATGAQGPIGKQGAAGPTGAKGNTGATGPTGPAGEGGGGGSSPWTVTGNDIDYSDGNVGIGANAPWGRNLTVHGQLEVIYGNGPSHLTLRSNEEYFGTYSDGGVSFSGEWASYSFIQNGSTRMFIKYLTGEVGIGTTDPRERLEVNGNIKASGEVIANSDARVKENVETIPNALEKVTSMRGVTYNKIGEKRSSMGVIAQEIQKIAPEVVHGSEDGILSVAYGNITAVLIEAIKEQQKQIDNLKSILNGFTN